MKKKGFTLIELLLVIAIIGILASVILVSTSSARNKANRVSALTTLASIMPEIAVCQDDGFGLNKYDKTKLICNDPTLPTPIHTEKWPDISKTGWVINDVTAPLAANGSISGYTYSAKKAPEADIVCTFANNSCN